MAIFTVVFYRVMHHRLPDKIGMAVGATKSCSIFLAEKWEIKKGNYADYAE
jgi:hypothetical protein